MKKRLFVILLICMLAVSALFATEESESSTTANVLSSRTSSNFRRGVTYMFEDSNKKIEPIYFTFYDDGTLIFIDTNDETRNSVCDYYVVGVEIYVPSSFAKYRLEITDEYDGYTSIGGIPADEQSVLLHITLYPSNHKMTYHWLPFNIFNS